ARERPGQGGAERGGRRERQRSAPGASAADERHLPARRQRQASPLQRALVVDRRSRQAAAQLGVAIFSRLPNGPQRLLELGVREALAQGVLQVVASRGEEAGEDLPVGRKARAIAIAAERLRDAGDEAELQ